MGGHQPFVGGRSNTRGAQQLQSRDAILFTDAGPGRGLGATGRSGHVLTCLVFVAVKN